MTKEDAYKIFIDEIANGNEELKVLVEKDVMMPIAFNSAWIMASKNQEAITKQEMIDKASNLFVQELQQIEMIFDDSLFLGAEHRVNEFRKAMKGK